VRGVVIDDSTGKPVAGARVHLLMSFCNANADGLGQFVFRDVRSGNERIEAGHTGYLRLSPFSIAVSPPDTIVLELRLRPGGPLEQCRVHPACARLLEPPKAGALSDGERFRLAALSTTIAIAWPSVASVTPLHACVEEASAAVIAQLADRYGPVAPRGQCAIPGDRWDTGARVRHTPTGEPGFFVTVRGVQDVGPYRKTALLVFNRGRLSGQGWECMFELSAQVWTPLQCVQQVEI
jgi:hypothetical protein